MRKILLSWIFFLFEVVLILVINFFFSGSLMLFMVRDFLGFDFGGFKYFVFFNR